MSAQHLAHPERLDELLATHATQMLSIEEERELEGLLDEFPDVDDAAFDFAAACIDLGHLRQFELEPMPATVRARVETDALACLARARGLELVGSAGPAPVAAASAPRAAGAPMPAEHAARDLRPGATWPWLIAAASLILAVAAWWPTTTPSPAAMYRQLSSATGALKASWNDDRGVITGEVYWDQASQRGVMRFHGLPANDPASTQYQLWIFDDARTTAGADGTIFNAVDGGVFDVEPVGGDVYVQVDPKLEVFDPALFAITTEPPGGVIKHVDTEDHRIILTAPVAG